MCDRDHPFPRFAASNQSAGKNDCEGLGPKLEPNCHAYSARSEEGFWTTYKGQVLPENTLPARARRVCYAEATKKGEVSLNPRVGGFDVSKCHQLCGLSPDSLIFWSMAFAF